MWWTSSADAKRLSAPVVVEVLPVDDEQNQSSQTARPRGFDSLGSPELKPA
jgi:hypothetical protein